MAPKVLLKILLWRSLNTEKKQRLKFVRFYLLQPNVPIFPLVKTSEKLELFKVVKKELLVRNGFYKWLRKPWAVCYKTFLVKPFWFFIRHRKPLQFSFRKLWQKTYLDFPENLKTFSEYSNNFRRAFFWSVDWRQICDFISPYVLLNKLVIFLKSFQTIFN